MGREGEGGLTGWCVYRDSPIKRRGDSISILVPLLAGAYNTSYTYIHAHGVPPPPPLFPALFLELSSLVPSRILSQGASSLPPFSFLQGPGWAGALPLM